MRLIILSDIHANFNALHAVIKDFEVRYQPDYIALLGDVVNYGMRPNEVISKIQSLEIPLICNLQGNHEKSLLNGEIDRFSTERGKRLLQYTFNRMSTASLSYIAEEMNREGRLTLQLEGKNILFIHGDIDDPFWGKLSIDKMKDNRYAQYDYVISGHTHIPHYVEHFFEINNPAMRNTKKTIFLNPGSVGQPRNHNACAQYLYLDLEQEIVHHNKVGYDIKEEQSFYPLDIDQFYKERLIRGI